MGYPTKYRMNGEQIVNAIDITLGSQAWRGGVSTITLNALSLSNNTYNVEAGPGAVVGALQNTTPQSTLSLNPASSQWTIANGQLRLGANPITTPGNKTVNIVETYLGVSRTTSLTIIAQQTQVANVWDRPWDQAWV